MSNELKLGQILDDTAKRDAIHVAIAPVVAGRDLEPGAHVGLVDGETDVEVHGVEVFGEII